MHSKYYEFKKIKTSYILERRECEISCRAFTFLCQLYLSLVVNIALDNIAFLLILVRVCLVQERRGTEPSGPVFALRVSERCDSFEGIFAQYSG